MRDVANTADLSFAASELLGKTLGAVRVGFSRERIDTSNAELVEERDAVRELGLI